MTLGGFLWGVFLLGSSLGGGVSGVQKKICMAGQGWVGGREGWDFSYTVQCNASGLAFCRAPLSIGRPAGKCFFVAVCDSRLCDPGTSTRIGTLEAVAM